MPDGTAGKTRFAQILSLPGTAIWGAEHDDRIVAMATLHVIANTTYGVRPCARVENMVTLQAYRGQGFGTAIMEAVVKAAWSADAYMVMLLTGKTLGAKGFFEKLGFTDQDKYGMTIRRVPARQQRE